MKGKDAIAVLTDVPFYDIIRTYKEKFFPQIPISLVLGHMEQESSFRPDAYRAEPQIKDASYGLMQLLHGTAKWQGYNGETDGLFDPMNNIYYGMKYIAYLMGQFPGNQEGFIMAYNEGPGNYRKGRRVQYYYDRVTKFQKKWQGILAAKGLAD